MTPGPLVVDPVVEFGVQFRAGALLDPHKMLMKTGWYFVHLKRLIGLYNLLMLVVFCLITTGSGGSSLPSPLGSILQLLQCVLGHPLGLLQVGGIQDVSSKDF